MGFTPQDLDQLGQIMVEAYSSQATIPADTDQGSQVQAILNAPKLPLGLIQAQNEYLQDIARLSTIPPNADGSPNPDVDSYINPFGLTRLPPVASTGNVTFSTSSNVTANLLIPVGVIAQTQGGLQFTVASGGTGYDSAANGYWITAGTNSVSVPVQCNVAGVIGNVQPNTITQVFAGPGIPPIAGVASVTNPQAFSNGTGYESDAAFIARFTNFVSTGSVATKNAIAAAITGVQDNITYSLADGVDSSGNPKAANFTVVVNTIAATDVAPSSLLSAVSNAVDKVRSAGITFAVVSPTMTSVGVGGTIKTNALYVSGSAESAVKAYINSIGLDPAGASTICSLGKVYAVIFALPGVVNVDNIQLNGGTSDITAAFAHQLMSGTVTFTFTS